MDDASEWRPADTIGIGPPAGWTGVYVGTRGERRAQPYNVSGRGGEVELGIRVRCLV